MQLRLLGSFELRDASGQSVRLSTRKAEALLALLALRPGQPQARDRLCALLWPDVRPAQAQHSLRQTLLQLRKGLSPALLASDVRGLQLSAAHVEVDVGRLERCANADAPEALTELWQWDRGELLEGFRVGEAPFDDWLASERKRLRELLAQALTRLLALAPLVQEAQRACARLLELDPLREEAHRGMMRLLAKQGRRAAALQHYRTFADALRGQLGTEPDPITEQLRAELEGTAVVRSLPLALSSPPSAAETSGRAAELQQLMAALTAARHGSTRVTLVAGEAGVGKTHVCERVAEAAAALGFRSLHARSRCCRCRCGRTCCATRSRPSSR
jgi:DNA-binding SARP family transcriptional activator